MNLYPVGKTLCKLFFSLFTRVTVIGKDNIPADGPVLLCSNHISNLDPPLVGTFMKRKIRFMAKQELFSKKIVGPLLSSLGAFPVKRGVGDRQSLRKGLHLLEEGEVLCLFPEGTRSKTGEIGEGLSGSGFFAIRSKAAVVPVVIFGPYKPFGKITIAYGEPMNFQELRDEKVNAAEATKKIMGGIQALKEKHIEEIKN
ncbi:1-acyl-sn-glycerol-3-phosphate acyltransferase [Salibacterium salarium]|uniref:lysophospholipid acyltransferase family protein n=1 Tax=Salibacterium salarium TaxID=284579 RepID=UPI0027809659|nr:lysophospholipid acyltransferase family protein [Salibacterium salarium]MDQ0299459.1 1-acyl-sn-glycerol-3-phosphate acyltransferase [Salibacterium salarium]